MRTIPALLSLAILAACGSQETGTVTGEDGSETSYSIDRDGGDTQVRVTNEAGEEVVVNSGEGAGVALPLGFTVYPGANVVSNSTVKTNDGEGSVLFMETSDSAEKVVAFYRSQAEAAGMNIALESNSAAARTIAGEAEGGKNFMLTATENESGTGVQLMVGQEPAG